MASQPYTVSQQEGVPQVTHIHLDLDEHPEVWFLLRSDAHHDNAKCQRDVEMLHLKQAVEQQAGILDMGDAFCAMQGRFDPRSSAAELRKEHGGGDYLDLLVAETARDYAFCADNFALLAPGNHETNIRKRCGVNLTKRLAEEMGRLGSPVQHSTYQGWVQVHIRSHGTRAGNYKIRYTHGYGGGGPVTEDSIQLARQLAMLEDVDMVLSGHCFSDDTEILTPNGWKRHEALRPGSPVATMNKQTGAMEWNHVNVVHRYDDYNELIAFDEGGCQLHVTPQHGMIYQRRRGATLRECTAEAMDGKTEVIFFGAAPAVGCDWESDDRLRLLAWTMADGSVEGRRLRFHLKKERKIERLFALLNRLHIDFAATVGADETTRVSVLPEAGGWLADALGPQKAVLPLLYCMNARQSELFALEYAHTDGTFYTDADDSGFQLYSSRRDYLDVLQAICVRAGFRASMAEREDCGRLNVCRKVGTLVPKVNTSRVPYSGTVWCVNVPNGTLVVRRNGVVTVTQNTHHKWRFKKVRERLDDKGILRQRTVDCLKLGTYKEEFAPGDGWAVEKGMSPKPLGGWWLIFCRQPGNNPGWKRRILDTDDYWSS